MVSKSDFDLSLEAPGDPDYWANLEQNNERIIKHYSCLVGELYTSALADDLSARINRPVRATGNRFVTADYRVERINLDLNENDVIRGVFFG